MTTPGHFEIYPSARPALPAGTYEARSTSTLGAVPPHGANGVIPVEGTGFRLHIDAPRYVLPPDQILSTFPPAGSQGDWRERLPQIVLKRRTLPWERNPKPEISPEHAPPWLALVVLAEGEGLLSTDVDVSQCVTSDVNLGADADVPQGRYLEVTEAVVEKVFPCQDELDLLCHVRKVDLRDTELALGDDDGYLAVVLANRLPQPAPPLTPGGEAQPRKYTAYLINLEKQVPRLLATEPAPVFEFDPTITLAEAHYMVKAPNATVDQIAMQLGPGVLQLETVRALGSQTAAGALVEYPTGKGVEPAAASWAVGPSGAAAKMSGDLAAATQFKDGTVSQAAQFLGRRYRFPVLVSWDFTCTATGGFERLMNQLDVGLLGTLAPGHPLPVPEVALTGHVGLDYKTRHGEAARSWFRGPLSPQPTVRGGPVLAHTGDQLRKVVPDGREDVSLAALFEIGRLLTMSKPTLVAALMNWRRELFGAARARELADLLAGTLAAGLGVGAIGGRSSLEALVRTTIVGAFTAAGPGRLAPPAREVTIARIPSELDDIDAGSVLRGLGVDPDAAYEATKRFGPEGLGALAVTVADAPTRPASTDRIALARLNDQLSNRVQRLTVDALKLTRDGGVARAAAAQADDDLDRLIAAAEAGE